MEVNHLQGSLSARCSTPIAIGAPRLNAKQMVTLEAPLWIDCGKGLMSTQSPFSDLYRLYQQKPHSSGVRDKGRAFLDQTEREAGVRSTRLPVSGVDRTVRRVPLLACATEVEMTPN